MKPKLKVYRASSVWLSGVEDRLRASNGNCQFFVLCRTTSIKRLAELAETTEHQLRRIGVGLAADQYRDIPKMDHVIYYHVDHTKNGYLGKWIAYHRNLPPNRKKELLKEVKTL